MRNKCVPLFSAMAIAVMVFNGTVLSAIARQEHGHGSEQIVKVGKNVDITLTKETRVGELTLQPGRYKLQHRVDGADHFVHFTEWTKSTSMSVPKAHPGEVKCRLEPLNAKVRQTEVHMSTEGGMQRITRVLVAGENVAHVF